MKLTRRMLLAVLASYWKWDYLSRHPEGDLDCALCKEAGKCEVCPLFQIGHDCNKENSVWHHWAEARTFYDLEGASYQARRMARILYSLIPEEFEL